MNNIELTSVPACVKPEEKKSVFPVTGGAPRALILKLCKIMAECENLPKLGRNVNQNYDYVRESEVVNGIRNLLAKHQVFLFHTVRGEQREPVQGKHSTQWVTRLELEYTFMDGDSGESHTTFHLGYGQDGSEKGYYKALAGAHKYFLMKQFNISAGEDDPENEPKESRRPQGERQLPPPAARKVADKPPVESLSKEQQAMLGSLFAEGQRFHYSADDISKLAKLTFPAIKSRKDLTAKQVLELKAFMRKNPNPPPPSEAELSANSPANGEPLPFERPAAAPMH